jgi:hypothetical protein
MNEFAWFSLCEDIYQFLVEITPVDTGLCRDSWEQEVYTEYAIFFNPTEYASYLEDGWSQQAPNGMIKPLLDRLPALKSQYAS